MSSNPYDTWTLLQKFHDDVNRLLGESGYGAPQGDTSRIATSEWAPAVDIKEETDRYVLYADLPGVDSADIEITMEDGVLTVAGTRRWQAGESREQFRRVERARGNFHRRFSLPDTADPNSVQASSRNGVLEISISKQQRAQPRRIEVSG